MNNNPKGKNSQASVAENVTAMNNKRKKIEKE